ncbi:MAG: hypothetical protein HY720_11105, partial [Planctomycetes bacterium]|nr:hypothetical protein [Planctomycetota bacterium]
MRVLFLASRPEKPSYRFRVAAFLPHLRERGWDVRVEFVPSGWWARRRLFRGLGESDIVFVQKRLFGALDLAAVRGHARRLVYDLDDAVMHAGEGR